ncbi:2Fe-2S iron-sulfur cluster-binding protein [[Mycobacterium] burgundiense]|uniref:2Fe-2S iron-sulfur cluster-binding protein n=1 Tax=[Mycobacterium] burgundiense TaxID=3064286 RepID=UPI0035A00F9A
MSEQGARGDVATTEATGRPGNGDVLCRITVRLDQQETSTRGLPGETLLESARRAGLEPPVSCEAGNCGTCMARLTEGRATMRNNDALTVEEVAEGYVLTCQAVPEAPSVTVDYDA